MRRKIKLICLLIAANFQANAQPRQEISLNGEWNSVIDQYDTNRGLARGDRPWGKNDREEHSIDDAPMLHVPGDWNSQREELKYYEGTIWYGRHITLTPESDKRYLLRFGGVSYRARVYVNGTQVATHEGSFTEFEADVTAQLRAGDNYIAVRVNNRRERDAIPAMSFDWFNYGGITRDVTLCVVPSHYISDYFIQLDKHRADLIHARVNLSDSVAGETVNLYIPELKKSVRMTTDDTGTAYADIPVKRLVRWCPANPKLYKVRLTTSTDTVSEDIGFRNIEVRGTQVLLNGEPIFLKGINIHEEIPMQKRRACTEADAIRLLDEAQALGVNMIRLAHYQQSRYMVCEAERRGILLWQEIPVWQAIDFSNTSTQDKAVLMLQETIRRDKNRCADCFWGIANETRNTPERNHFLARLLQAGRETDTTRLFVAAFDLARFDRQQDKFVMKDDFYHNLDVVGINKYMGWYEGWPKAPKDIRWDVCSDKPLLISEFGGEAKYGIHDNGDVAGSWSEEFQARIYQMNLEMFANIPNLVGICPWILFDFRSPTRLHQTFQEGFNRKGLVGDKGERKQAWHIIHNYYKER
ncbi:MAG: beta galactosidase jelly roll domain-containing protein [Bacteroidaceae bacterium]|nr:beta galactosidase jelly roll domain-containing protein [Bacteroidaceae bacterium]